MEQVEHCGTSQAHNRRRNKHEYRPPRHIHNLILVLIGVIHIDPGKRFAIQGIYQIFKSVLDALDLQSFDRFSGLRAKVCYGVLQLETGDADYFLKFFAGVAFGEGLDDSVDSRDIGMLPGAFLGD
jgi:hypothetical protein